MPDKQPPSLAPALEHMDDFSQLLADILSKAYLQMTHPDLKEYRDQLYIGPMAEVGKLRKAISGYKEEQQGTFTGKFIEQDIQKGQEFLGMFINILSSVSQTSEVMGEQLRKMNTDAESARELTDEQTAKLDNLWERYQEKIEDSPVKRAYKAVLNGMMENDRERFELMEHNINNYAVVNAATLEAVRSSKQLLESAYGLDRVQKALTSFIGNYIISQDQSPDLPPQA